MDVLPGTRAAPQLDEAWPVSAAGARLDALRRAAPRLRDAIRATGEVAAVRSFDVARFPYPTRFAFGGACRWPGPVVFLKNRALLIEYRDFEGVRRRLLANPGRVEGASRAPYFQDVLRYQPPALRPFLQRHLAQAPEPIEVLLEQAGVPRNSVDFVCFDHLHVQDLRPLFGPEGYFPRARLLVTETEWAAVAKLHPMQRYWYVDQGVCAAKWVQPFAGDVMLGAGLALVRTPGHTEGNHSVVLSLPGGLMTVSENGVAPDAYAPERSRIPGLARFARRTGYEVVLNANTRERTLDQYSAMVVEKILAAPDEAEAWPRHFASSELVGSWLTPGIRPTHAVCAVEHGAFERAPSAMRSVA